MCCRLKLSALFSLGQNYEYFVKDQESRIREMEIMDRLLEVISLERYVSMLYACGSYDFLIVRKEI